MASQRQGETNTLLQANIDFIGDRLREQDTNNSVLKACCKKEQSSFSKLCMLTTCVFGLTICSTVISAITYTTVHDLAHDIRKDLAKADNDLAALAKDFSPNCTNSDVFKVVPQSQKKRLKRR